MKYCIVYTQAGDCQPAIRMSQYEEFQNSASKNYTVLSLSMKFLINYYHYLFSQYMNILSIFSQYSQYTLLTFEEYYMYSFIR